MVNLRMDGKSEFLKDISSKKIYCFGAGRLFRRFLSNYSEVKVCGVIDNYLADKQSHMVVDGIQIPILSLEEYGLIHDSDSVLVITAGAYEEIIQQLDFTRAIDGMDCFLTLFLCNQEGAEERVDSLISWIKKVRESQENFAEFNQTSRVKRFQIWNRMPDYKTAGNKAMEDIRDIAGAMGYQEIDIHLLVGNTDSEAKEWSVERNRQEWERCYEIIPKDSVLLLQHPTWQLQSSRTQILRRLKKEKNVKIISVMHDVESLRKVYDDSVKQDEFSIIFELTDVFVVHTQAMKSYFLSIGVEENRVVVLGIFDYLAEAPVLRHMDKSIVVAGNLDGKKSPYVGKLRLLQNIKINLFGVGYMPSEENKNIVYHGASPADEIAQALCGGFGLVWDGDSLDTCGGYTGKYLRYNSPHKCSLYLAAGLPVIVWKEAALAGFVREHCVGIAVDSLYEISEMLTDMTEERYKKFIENIKPVSKALRNGENTKRAIMEAEKLLGLCDREGFEGSL